MKKKKKHKTYGERFIPKREQKIDFTVSSLEYDRFLSFLNDLRLKIKNKPNEKEKTY